MIFPQDLSGAQNKPRKQRNYYSRSKKTQLGDPTFLGVRWKFLQHGSKDKDEYQNRRQQKFLTEAGREYLARSKGSLATSLSRGSRQRAERQHVALPDIQSSEHTSFERVHEHNAHAKKNVEELAKTALTAAERKGLGADQPRRRLQSRGRSRQRARTSTAQGFLSIEDEIAAINARFAVAEALPASSDEDYVGRESRSPSPLIVWRPTARVKVASDITPALRSALMGDVLEDPTKRMAKNEENKHALDQNKFKEQIDQKMNAIESVVLSGPTGGDSDADEDVVADADDSAAVQKQWGRRKKRVKRKKYVAPTLPDSSFTYVPPKRGRRPEYGAWYIDPKKWRLRHAHEFEGSESDSDVASSQLLDTMQGKESSQPEPIGGKENQLLQDIPYLYISRAYKTFIKDIGDNERIPHYLKACDVFADSNNPPMP
jgi:hypothetical protein